jgi:hypothetical protein
VSDDRIDPSPSERYAAYARDKEHPALRDFSGLYDFPLDEFQVRACREIEEGRGVLVAAPTGSGKTIVGEFAIHLALTTGRKCFYTTPIKALSNQKYNDLVARYGAERVGLLTGDNAVNGEAPVVVMTTEVLRNMLYSGSPTLLGLGFVVMDEVHYLADRMRGAVWEEVIIHLPDSVTLVSLSATVSNAEEFGEWLETVRGETTTIVEEKRPVPLFQHVMVGRKLYDLFAASDVDASAGFVKEGAPVNDQLVRVARDDWRIRIELELCDVGGIGGTLAGNALSMAAMRATLSEVLTEDAFRHMIPLAERWTDGVESTIADSGLPWHVTRLGCRAEYLFGSERPRNGSEAAAMDDFETQRFTHLYALNRGVLMTPFHNMALMSPATSEADVDRHSDAFAAMASELA